jgi:hypothetical protein
MKRVRAPQFQSWHPRQPAGRCRRPTVLSCYAGVSSPRTTRTVGCAGPDGTPGPGACAGSTSTPVSRALSDRAVWRHTLVGDPMDRNVVLSTYLRWTARRLPAHGTRDGGIRRVAGQPRVLDSLGTTVARNGRQVHACSACRFRGRTGRGRASDGTSGPYDTAHALVPWPQTWPTRRRRAAGPSPARARQACPSRFPSA